MSFIENDRRHVGLEQLITLAATGHTFLGPTKRYKFVKDETSGDSVMVSSCFRLLENLEPSCSVGQLLSETIHAQQKVFHSGTSSLLFLAGAWSRAALECLHQGIAVRHILCAMSEGLEVCLEVCRARAVPVKDVLHLGWGLQNGHTLKELGGPSTSLISDPFVKSCLISQDRPNVIPSTQPRCQDHPSAACKKTEKQSAKVARSKIKLTHSRHFTSNETTDSEKRTTQRSVAQLHSLAFTLSHGCEKAMDLVIQASMIQLRITEQGDLHKMFDVSKLVTCSLPGLPEDQACVFSGYVVLLSAEQTSIISHLKDQRVNIVLLNGDLTVGYRHVGFSNPASIRHVTDKQDEHRVNREQKWMDSGIATLLKYSVSVVLLNGVASKQMTSHCLKHNILVIEAVRPAVLSDFSKATGAIPVSYLSQVNQRCVGSSLRLQVWREYCHSGQGADSITTAVCVTAEHTTLVTAVITSPVHGKLQSLEDQFWGCAHRLHQALKDSSVLPGGGLVEIHCILELQKRIENMGNWIQDERYRKPYVGRVFQLMLDGLKDYVSTLLCNSAQLSCKLDAWTQINKQLKDLKGDLNNSVTKPLWELNCWACTDPISQVERVFDNVTVKMEAWRRALDLVFLVLQTDSEIIIGFDAKDENLQLDSFMSL